MHRRKNSSPSSLVSSPLSFTPVQIDYAPHESTCLDAGALAHGHPHITFLRTYAFLFSLFPAFAHAYIPIHIPASPSLHLRLDSHGLPRIPSLPHLLTYPRGRCTRLVVRPRRTPGRHVSRPRRAAVQPARTAGEPTASSNPTPIRAARAATAGGSSRLRDSPTGAPLRCGPRRAVAACPPAHGPAVRTRLFSTPAPPCTPESMPMLSRPLLPPRQEAPRAQCALIRLVSSFKTPSPAIPPTPVVSSSSPSSQWRFAFAPAPPVPRRACQPRAWVQPALQRWMKCAMRSACRPQCATALMFRTDRWN
ncbi:hypothetical protein OBBRIDRAFT_629693 [Obba rivulosa]|uniref:Uncharacterized protein n=1 Tax=Obba rivulosa TaxID=1052685 RepID=A0A8E2DKH1_9APHY|nr:hypothetical protein OBBRIDRAFT_629693 [Obba rivulosa]